MTTAAQQKWTDVWRLFDEDEQVDACECLISSFDEEDDWIGDRIKARIADATKFRPTEVRRLAKQDPHRLARMLRPRVASVLEEDSWASLFREFYFARKRALMCAFLQ